MTQGGKKGPVIYDVAVPMHWVNTSREKGLGLKRVKKSTFLLCVGSFVRAVTV